MPVSESAVRVEGLAELRRALGGIDKALPKHLAKRLKAVGERVAANARGRMPSRSGRARSSVKAGTSGNTAHVQGGRKAIPYYGWLDFGGTLRPTGGRRNTQRRPKLKKGRYLYPAIDAMGPQIKSGASDAFSDTKRQLGLH